MEYSIEVYAKAAEYGIDIPYKLNNKVEILLFVHRYVHHIHTLLLPFHTFLYKFIL